MSQFTPTHKKIKQLQHKNYTKQLGFLAKNDGKSKVRERSISSKGSSQKNLNFIQRLVGQKQKYKQENKMFNQYFDVFERKYLQKKKQLETCKKQNEKLKIFLRKLQNSTEKQRSISNSGTRSTHKRIQNKKTSQKFETRYEYYQEPTKDKTKYQSDEYSLTCM